jgi:hypothetical protein
MPGLTSGPEPYHVTLTTADGLELGLISVAPDGKPHEFEGSLTPVDATEQFRPGGIPREFDDFSAGAGYTFADERVPNGYSWSKNVWTLVPHAATPSGALTEIALPATDDGGTHGTITHGFELNNFIYLSSGKYEFVVTGPTFATAIPHVNFASTAGISSYVSTSVCLYQGKAYWGGTLGGTQPYRLIEYSFATNTFTVNATCNRMHVASFGGVDAAGNWAQWMIGTVASNASFKYTNSTSPLLDTNWTPGDAVGTTLGDISFSVQKIVTARQKPFILKQNGIFTIERLGQYVPNVTPHWQDSYHTNNGVAAVIVGGVLYANVLDGIDAVRGLDGQLNDTPFLVGPGADLPNESPAVGDCYAMCRDGDWLVAAFYNPSNETSYICWGRPRAAAPGQPGLTNFIWHISPCVIEGEKVTFLMKSAGSWPTGEPRLWIATRNAANTQSHLYWLSLPRNHNPLQEIQVGGPWRCRTDTCTLYLSSNPWSQGVHSQKAIRQVATVSKDASDTSYLEVYVSPDEATREQLGARVTESPYVESRILDDISGRQMAASVDFKAGSSTTPPILRAVTVWAGEGVRATTTYAGRFRFGRGVKIRNKTIDTTADMQAAWELLIGSQGPRPATIVDWKGVTYTVAFEQGAEWHEREVRDGGHWEIDATLRFTVLAREVAWNDGAVYDSEASYVA